MHIDTLEIHTAQIYLTYKSYQSDVTGPYLYLIPIAKVTIAKFVNVTVIILGNVIKSLLHKLLICQLIATLESCYPFSELR